MQFSGFNALLRRYPYCAICAALTIALGVTAWILHGQIADLEVLQSDRAKEGEATLDLLVGVCRTPVHLRHRRQLEADTDSIWLLRRRRPA